MATVAEIVPILKTLGDVYPSFRLSGSAIEVYAQLLADIPGAVLEQAALDHISRSNYFPTIAELRSAAFNIIEASNPTPTDYEAWAEVQAEIRRVGHCGQPKFENPLAEQVVQQLGWRYLCLSENPMADRAHFIQAYKALLEQDRIRRYRPRVIAQFIEAPHPAHQLPEETSGAACSNGS